MTKTRHRLIPIHAIVVAIGMFIAQLHAADETEMLSNPGFEDGVHGWTISVEDEAEGFSKVVAEAAHTGKLGLRVSQPASHKNSSSIASDFFAVHEGDILQVTYRARTLEPGGIGVVLQFFDEHKQLVTPSKTPFLAAPQSVTDWTAYDFRGTAPQNAAYARIWVHAWSNATCKADFDDFSLKIVK